MTRYDICTVTAVKHPVQMQLGVMILSHRPYGDTNLTQTQAAEFCFIVLQAFRMGFLIVCSWSRNMYANPPKVQHVGKWQINC